MAEDMFTMRQEALRRAREMHSRAAPMPQQSNNRTQPPPRQQEQHQPPPHQPEQHRREEKKGEAPEKKTDIFETLFKDKDKTIILALLILLSGEGEKGDNTLLYALMYLLM